MFSKASLPVILASAALVPVTPAAAQSSTDPQAASPSGQIYEIPLDTARGDAAPHRSSSGQHGNSGAGGGSGGGSGTSGGSSIRSENNFGSSSQVPGLEPSGAAGNKSKHGQRRDRNANGGAGAAGPGSAGGSGQAGATSSVPAAAHGVGETSTGGTLVLLLALTAGGVGARLVSARAARLGRPPLSEG